MRILITAGPTHEPIDSVRYIGNRSSGKMGAALARASAKAGHQTTLILGPVNLSIADGIHRIDVQTAAEMLDAVLREFPDHDLLIMAAAVADYRTKSIAPGKLPRGHPPALELQPTQDIIAAAGKIKRPNQRTVGFSLESTPDLDRPRRKLQEKNLDLMVHNTLQTLAADTIQPTLLFPDGRTRKLPSRLKADFADMLIQQAVELFSRSSAQ